MNNIKGLDKIQQELETSDTYDLFALYEHMVYTEGLNEIYITEEDEYVQDTRIND